MKLFAFGDSWTEGIGSDVREEMKIEDHEERTKFRNSMSWPKYLADLLNIDFVNYGMGAASNKV